MNISLKVPSQPIQFSYRDLFRILRNFARHATIRKQPDLPFAIQHVAARMGVSFQHMSKLRHRFADTSIIVVTKPAVTNRSAARFRWCLGMSNATEYHYQSLPALNKITEYGRACLSAPKRFNSRSKRQAELGRRFTRLQIDRLMRHGSPPLLTRQFVIALPRLERLSHSK
jgi:hypothetical protein